MASLYYPLEPSDTINHSSVTFINTENINEDIDAKISSGSSISKRHGTTKEKQNGFHETSAGPVDNQLLESQSSRLHPIFHFTPRRTIEEFDTSSFARYLAYPPSFSEEQQYDGRTDSQNVASSECAPQPTDLDILPEACDSNMNYVSTRYPNSCQPTLLKMEAKFDENPLTLHSTDLQSHSKIEDEGMELQYKCKLNDAAIMTRRFSDLSLEQAICPSIDTSDDLLESKSTSDASHPTITNLASDLNTPKVIASIPVKTLSSTASSIYFPPTASALHQKRRKALKQELRVPRPKNCFMLYRSMALPIIMAEFGSINNKIISKIAAERWRAEPEDVKVWYRDMAKYGKEEHARNNPGYKYAPLNKMRTITTSAVRRIAGSVKKNDIIRNDSEGTLDGSSTTENNHIRDSLSRRQSVRQHQRQYQHQPQPNPRSRPRSQASKQCTSAYSFSISPQNIVVGDTRIGPTSYSPHTVSSPYLDDPSDIPTNLYLSEQQQEPSTPYRTSMYGHFSDKNASEVTLVDPVDHWTTHQYLSTSACNSSSNHTDVTKVDTSMLSPSKLMVFNPKYLMEKELPPLPHQASNQNNLVRLLPLASSSSTAFHANSLDPAWIMSQMFHEYNSYSPFCDQESCYSIQTQARPLYEHQQHQLFASSVSSSRVRATELSFTTKEPPFVPLDTMDMGYDSTSIFYQLQEKQQHQQQYKQIHEQNPFQQAFYRHTQQQQYHH
ncbi:hypothetical protein FBU30_007700 [Linnemannia zychae]|nr:hypothetical protein FBU30_007700 [Linnemannia zychae]